MNEDRRKFRARLCLDGRSEIVVAKVVAVTTNVIDDDVLLNDRVYKDKDVDGWHGIYESSGCLRHLTISWPEYFLST